MTPLKRHHVIAFFFCWLGWAGVGFSQEYHFQNFNELNGLPSSETYQVFQDRQGFIWIASDNGVVRYDGEDFVNYNSAQGLTDNTVFSFFEDHRKRVWFRTFSGLLSYFDPATDKITPFQYNKTLQKALRSNVLNDLKVDHNGGVWFSPNWQGPSGRIREDGVLEEFEFTKDTSYVYLQSIDSIGKEYAIGIMGTLSLRGIKINSTYFPVNINQEFKNSPVAIYAHWRGGIYISINRDVFCYRNGVLTKVFTAPQPIIGLSVDQADHLWLGLFSGGVLQFANEKMDDGKGLQALAHASVSSILNDREGGFWFSTLDRGVFYFPNLSIQVFTYGPAVVSKISEIASGKNRIYIGRYNGEVTSLSAPFAEPVVLHKDISPVSCLTEDRAGNLWGASVNGFFYSVQGQSQSVRGGGLSLRGFFQSANGEMNGYNSSGFYRLDHKGGVHHRHWLIKRPTQIIENKGITYVGSLSGLERLDEKLKHLDRDTFLIKSRVSVLHVFNDKLWVGTIGNGLLLLDGNKVIDQNRKSFPMVQNVYALISTGQQLWVATDVGVFIGENIPGGEMIWNHLTGSSGLLSEKCTDLAFLNDTIWVFSERGISFVPVNVSHFSNRMPIIFSRHLKINSLDWSGDLSTLNSDQNNLSLDIGAISFNNRKLRFRHRLTETSEWNYSTESNISYFSLRPGDYELEVQASLNELDWVPYDKVLKFSISPPWWATWTFRAFLIIFFLAIGFVAYRLRMNSARRKNSYLELINSHQQRLIDSEIQTQERERKRIAKDLHDGVGTSLSSIKLLVSDAFKAEPGERTRKVQEINDTLTEVISDIKQIVYDLHPPVLERYGLQVALKNLTDKINNHGGISILFDYYGQREVSASTTISIYRIIQELINNTLKHAKASEIRIHVNQFDDEMNIMYEDNGVGMVGSRFTGLGLHNIESRVRSLQGRMSWESNHKGTFYNFDIPF